MVLLRLLSLRFAASSDTLLQLQIGILVFSLVFGRVSRLLNGFDDYGNTCGVINNHPEFNGEPYTNQDMTGRP